jgi:hypothetical protein
VFVGLASFPLVLHTGLQAAAQKQLSKAVAASCSLGIGLLFAEEPKDTGPDYRGCLPLPAWS